ncbi:MAG: hypothetical protein K9M98_01980 [Cephaloticoccus sp.]|nr:hypothetical protein [Cephaloticoccus sp.]MCF7759248.1 hypothetical protein [Cephaloticoccus sp.]
MRGFLFALCLLVVSWGPLPTTGFAQEVQQHGLVFEKWVRDTFFAGYVPPGYTQKWDIPAGVNQNHGGLPVNPKAIKYRAPVDLGDALRQYDIDEPFILVIGYWQQEEGEKRFVNIVAPIVTPEVMKKLWGDITRADLERLDALIKDRAIDYREVRRQAQAMKKTHPFNTSLITLNPKIDSRGQRRLQCSLSFTKVFKHLAPDADPGVQDPPSLWGVVSAAMGSGPRRM